MLGSEVLEPLDHRVATDQPRTDPLAAIVRPVPNACRLRAERVTDRRANLTWVTGEQQLDLPGQPADRDHVVPMPGCIGGADHVHTGFPEDQQRVAAFARERVRLDPPTILRQRGQPALEL